MTIWKLCDAPAVLVAGVARAGTVVALLFAVTACTSHASGGARTPEQAALGFDTSLQGNHGPDYACPGSTMGVVQGIDHPGPRTARAIRVGDTWRVTVTEGSPSNSASVVYEVHRRNGKYCVAG